MLIDGYVYDNQVTRESCMASVGLNIKCISSVLSVPTKRTITSQLNYWTQKRSQQIALEIQALAYDRHRCGEVKPINGLPSLILSNMVHCGLVLYDSVPNDDIKEHFYIRER